jgi:hypothetical protein
MKISMRQKNRGSRFKWHIERMGQLILKNISKTILALFIAHASVMLFTAYFLQILKKGHSNDESKVAIITN